jgi:hypothetical protein
LSTSARFLAGSTLFGGAAIVRRNAEPGAFIRAFVAHFVCEYSHKKLTPFVRPARAEPAISWSRRVRRLLGRR